MTKSFLSVLPFLLLIQICSSKFDDIAVYCCQNLHEGNLRETCATGKYSFVVINDLYSDWPRWVGRINNFTTGYCEPSSSECTSFGSEIKYCQQQGSKVMLSLQALSRNYSFSSSDDAQKAFDYLWNNFLGGSSSSRPLGDVILDGIDFDIGETTLYLDDLARYLHSHSTDSQKLYLSAAPGCPFPDASLGTALDTGVFDYVWVKFFNNPTCPYSEANPMGFVGAWNQWAGSLYGTKSKIFLGLPPSQETLPSSGYVETLPSSGYVPPDLLISEVLPTVKKAPNYGGVMLWSSDDDRLSGYSSYLQLCTPQSAPKCRNHDTDFEERLGYMSTDSIKVYDSEVGGQCCKTICRNNCSCEAYAPMSQTNNTGCQIWLKGTRFTEDAGSKGQSIYIVRHKGTPCSLTCTRL